MSEDAHGDVTRILDRISRGDREAEEALIERIYQELRRSAGAMMRNERPGHILQPTALVHEAFLRLRPHLFQAANRRQLFAAAHKAMRRVLIDHARARRAWKRTPGEPEEPRAQQPWQPWHLELAEALEELGEIDSRERAIVEYRFFLGLKVEEVADQLGLSVSQIEKDWRAARAWLYRRLEEKR
jgi:RNA polymerase sigma-70 factor, ECF subfamily